MKFRFTADVPDGIAELIADRIEQHVLDPLDVDATVYYNEDEF